MRKVILFIHSTFNGVVTGDPTKDKTNFMVWTNEAFMKAGSESLLKTMETVDTILLGRATYEDLTRKWPNVKEWPGVNELALRLGEKVNNTTKLVATHDDTLDDLKWGDFEAPKPLTGNVVENVKDLKKGDGGDIVIFGSPTLVRALTDANLIDEYQIQVAPVVVNVGEHLFDDLKDRKDFHLIDAKPLEGGSIFVRYEPAEHYPGK